MGIELNQGGILLASDRLLTVLLGACVLRRGLCGGDPFSGLLGHGDHKVVDLLEVEVGHGDG